MVLLGVIQIVNGGSKNNTNTLGQDFRIPHKFPRLLIVTPSDVSGNGYNLKVGADSAYPSAFAAAPTDFGVAGSTSTQVQCPNGSPDDTILAIYGSGDAGNASIYGTYGEAQG